MTELELVRWYMQVRRADYCPATGGHVHSYINMILWGNPHPHCAACGYDDITRLVE